MVREVADESERRGRRGEEEEEEGVRVRAFNRGRIGIEGRKERAGRR